MSSQKISNVRKGTELLILPCLRPKVLVIKIVCVQCLIIINVTDRYSKLVKVTPQALLPRAHVYGCDRKVRKILLT